MQRTGPYKTRTGQCMNMHRPYWPNRPYTGKGYFAERGMRNAESCERVICGKFTADFFCGMKGNVRNESMRNVTEMNICKKPVLAVNWRHIKV